MSSTETMPIDPVDPYAMDMPTASQDQLMQAQILAKLEAAVPKKPAEPTVLPRFMPAFKVMKDKVVQLAQQRTRLLIRSKFILLTLST